MPSDPRPEPTDRPPPPAPPGGTRSPSSTESSEPAVSPELSGSSPSVHDPSGAPPPPAPRVEPPPQPPPAPNLLSGPPEAAAEAGYTPDPPETTPHRLPLKSLVGGLNARAVWGILPAAIVLRDAAGLSALALIAIGLVLVQLGRLAVWSRFRWGFDGHVVRISSGILWHRLRALDVERIQQVDVERPLLHQLIGTAVLTVETASEGGESEVRLDGLDIETATTLKSAILAARRREAGTSTLPARAGHALPGTPGDTTDGAGGTDAVVGMAATGVDGATSEVPATTILKPGIGDLVRSALTGSSLLVVPLSILALGEFAFDILGDDIDEVATEAAQAGARIGYVALALLVLVAGVIGAVVTILLRDWDIELVREGNDLRLSRGLLTTHAATIPLHRLQVVQYRQNWLRRALGAGTLVLRSAGGGSTPQDAASTVSIPWVTEEDLPDVLEAVLAEAVHTHSDLPGDLVAHPPAARRRLVWRWSRGLAVFVPVVVGLAIMVGVDTFPVWFAILGGSVLAVGGGAWLLGRAEYRRLGHATTNQVVRVAGGIIGARSDWMPLGRVQGVQGVANIFQRRLGLASVQLSPAGKGNTPVVIADVGTDTASGLADHFTLVAAGRAPEGSPFPTPTPRTT